jgi:hypothetical protein
MRVEFIDTPTGGCWISYPYLVCRLDDTFCLKKCTEFKVPTNRLTNDDIPDIVEDVFQHPSPKGPIVFEDTQNDYIVLACTVSRILGVPSHTALSILKTSYYASGYRINLLPATVDRILDYRRPLKVLMCGDRASGTIFDETIRMELSNLPKYSVVIHGGCKGVDVYAGRLAKELGLTVIVYEAEWDKYGKGAGPVRNKLMLTEESPDIVFAFHPDITYSKGTANMMMQARENGVEVWLHSLKRKVKYEGQELGDL